MADTSDRIDRLYSEPLDRFTAAREQLAGALRDQGQAGAAARVRKLRRPTIAAWAVNQLVRQHPGEVQELLSVGREVRAAAVGRRE